MKQQFMVREEESLGARLFRLTGPDGLEAVIVPQWGNNCVAFNRSGRPVLEPTPLEAVAKKPTSYGIPILFPFPNRVRDGQFEYSGTVYRVDPPRHGFVRDRAWKVEASGADQEGAWLTSRFDSRDYPEVLKQFPFPFLAKVTFRLSDRGLVMETEAENLGSRTMPVGLGTHAYFHRSTEGTLAVPAAGRWELADSLPTGRVIEVDARYDLRDPKPLKELELDDIYTRLIPESDGKVRCRLTDPENGLLTTVEFTEEEFPEVVIYTAPAPRQAVCIEPYTCPTDVFNLAARGVDSHLVELHPGETRRWTFAITVEQV